MRVVLYACLVLGLAPSAVHSQVLDAISEVGPRATNAITAKQYSRNQIGYGRISIVGVTELTLDQKTPIRGNWWSPSGTPIELEVWPEVMFGGHSNDSNERVIGILVCGDFTIAGDSERDERSPRFKILGSEATMGGSVISVRCGRQLDPKPFTFISASIPRESKVLTLKCHNLGRHWRTIHTADVAGKSWLLEKDSLICKALDFNDTHKVVMTHVCPELECRLVVSRDGSVLPIAAPLSRNEAEGGLTLEVHDLDKRFSRGGPGVQLQVRNLEEFEIGGISAVGLSKGGQK